MTINDERLPAPVLGLAPVPPGAIPTHDVKPMVGPAYIRREALRLSLEYHRTIEDYSPDTDILATAARFAEFIRTGATPELLDGP